MAVFLDDMPTSFVGNNNQPAVPWPTEKSQIGRLFSISLIKLIVFKSNQPQVCNLVLRAQWSPSITLLADAIFFSGVTLRQLQHPQRVMKHWKLVCQWPLQNWWSVQRAMIFSITKKTLTKRVKRPLCKPNWILPSTKGSASALHVLCGFPVRKSLVNLAIWTTNRKVGRLVFGDLGVCTWFATFVRCWSRKRNWILAYRASSVKDVAAGSFWNSTAL